MVHRQYHEVTIIWVGWRQFPLTEAVARAYRRAYVPRRLRRAQVQWLHNEEHDENAIECAEDGDAALATSPTG